MIAFTIWDWIYAGAIIGLIVITGSMFAVQVFKTHRPRTPATPNDKGGLELIYWECRCHGHRYCYPGACLHTDERNLIRQDGTKEALARALEEVPRDDEHERN